MQVTLFCGRQMENYIVIKMETKEKTYLTIGIFILLAAVGTTYYIVQEDPAFYCNDTNLVGLCWKLSNINDAGLQTRCYYNESAPTRYKNCKTGWLPYENLNVTGTPINDTGIWIDVEFEIDKLTALKNKGITYPELTPCIKIDNFICESRIYEKGGINKPLIVTYKFCENETCWALTQEELEEELRSKAIELLDKIALIEMKRQQPKEDILLTEAIKINITG